jgi:hypothetical protein
MILATECLAEKALDGASVRQALTATGLDKVLLVASKESVAAGLMGLPAVAVYSDWETRSRGIAAAQQAGSERLVLRLPDDWSVGSACRALFDLAREAPGLGLAVVTPEAGELAELQNLALVFEDLSSNRPGYWHQPSVLHRRGESDVDWLDQLGRHMVGLSLDDVAGGQGGLPPGTGELDFAVLAELTGRSLEATLHTDPLPDVAMLKLAVANLKTAGFQ